MKQIELYIDRQLCDVGNAKDFNIDLKRQFINPAELSVKDAQKSYEIELPATETNNRIFKHVNIEEVSGKFTRYYDALLIVGGITILDGQFRMSEITPHSYKGNLGVPAKKTVSELFGDMTLANLKPWTTPFRGSESISSYNKLTDQIPDCIFPLVIYGLFNKSAEGNREEIDSNTTFSLTDFPPSINCMETIKRIFDAKNMEISGSAFNDERLTNLYMSYANSNEYAMPFNYGDMASVSLSGKWTNCNTQIAGGKIDDWMNINEDKEDNEDIDPNDHDARILYYNKNLFNLKSEVGNTITIGNNDAEMYRDNKIIVPYSGLYKIVLNANIMLDQTHSGRDWRATNSDGTTSVIVVSPQKGSGSSSNIKSHRFEVKLLRSIDGEEIDNKELKWDNRFHWNNQSQDPSTTSGLPQSYSGVYPEAGGVNFIDPAQNKNYLCGLAWGKTLRDGWRADYNPRDTQPVYGNPTAIKNGKTNLPFGEKHQAIAATQSNRYGYLGGETGPDPVYNVSVANAPACYAKLTEASAFKGEGQVSQVVWLNAGEELTLHTVSDEASLSHKRGWIHHSLTFDLSVSFFKENADWIKIDADHNSTGNMNWNDDTDLKGNIDLTRFLPQTAKANDWVENFCKAFNLQLTQTEETRFELNTKPQQSINTSLTIDLDRRANVNHRTNSSLQLPALYDIGFTCKDNEQGYQLSDKDTGGGKFYTDSMETSKIEQKSNFSYNWFKSTDDSTKNKSFDFPIITEQEIWNTAESYTELRKKKYFNQPQRFWYRQQDADRFYPVRIGSSNNATDTILLSEKYAGEKDMVLNYKNEPDSILRNYFTIFADAGNHYTEVECFLLPEEYSILGHSLVRFNGDTYYASEIDGYDPLGQNKARLKLIRKTI